MDRRILIIILVIILGGVGAWAYFYFTASAPAITATPGGTTLPAAGGGSSTAAPASGNSSETAGTPQPVTARLVKISAGPVVPGEAVVTTPAKNASSTAATTVSFIDRRSGNVYAYGVQAHTLTRISNRTIPGIQSASWLPDASLAYVRYLSGANLSTVNTYALPATGEGGFFLTQDLADLAVSASNILTLASGVNGSVGSLLKTDGTHAAQAFTTPLTSLRAAFAGKGKYVAFSKPSTAVPGAAFLIDSSGRFTRLAGPLPGLVALPSPSGAYVLVSYANGSTLSMELVNTATLETLALPVATIADKCVWTADSSAVYCGVPTSLSPSYAYPDDWYQGAVSLDDRIWKIQVAGRYAQLVLDFSQEAKSGTLDAEAFAIDAAGTTLVFVNKNDGSLWAYSL